MKNTMANFTRQAIKAALIELLEEQPLTKISVRMLTERCGINRNTFYYHYHDIPAALEDITIEQTNELIKSYPSISSLKEAFRVAFDYALQHRQAILHIYHAFTRDIFVENTLKLCRYTVSAYIAAAFPDIHLSKPDHDALISVLSSLLLGIVMAWIADGMPSDAMESMDRMLELCEDVPSMIIQKSFRQTPSYR